MIEKNENQLIITYRDNGLGYNSSILHSSEKLDSFGIVLMTSLSEQINGKIDLSNNNGAQMRLTISTPTQPTH